MKFRLLNNFAKPALLYQMKLKVETFTQAFSKDAPLCAVLQFYIDFVIRSWLVSASEGSDRRPPRPQPHLPLICLPPAPALSPHTRRQHTHTQLNANTSL